MNSPIVAAQPVVQAQAARRWLRHRLVLWTVITVVLHHAQLSTLRREL